MGKLNMGFPGDPVIKNPSVSVRDVGLILELGRFPERGYSNSLQYSCLRIPWTEEPGRLQSTGSQRVRHD